MRILVMPEHLNGLEIISISHYKIHFRIIEKERFSKGNCICTKKNFLNHKNFCIFKNKLFTYIVFHSGFINIVGIRERSHCLTAVALFTILFKVSPEIINKKLFEIDNITAKGNLLMKLDLRHLYCYIKKYTKFAANYNPLHFCALYLALTEKGKVLLFSSGKISIVGTQCLSQLEEIRLHLCVLMNNYMKKYTKERSLAKSALL